MQPDKQHKQHMLLLNEIYLLIYSIISAQMMCYHLLRGGGGYKLTNVVTHIQLKCCITLQNTLLTNYTTFLENNAYKM